MTTTYAHIDRIRASPVIGTDRSAAAPIGGSGALNCGAFITECATSARWHLRRSGGLDSPRHRRCCSGCRCVAADIGGRGTASGQGNGLVAVVTVAGELGLSATGGCLRGRLGGEGPERFRVAAGHRPGAGTVQDCQSVLIYSSDQCPGRIRTCAHGSGGRRCELADCAVDLLGRG
jgi:hypothetical protein